jgi:hypothetical protein
MRTRIRALTLGSLVRGTRMRGVPVAHLPSRGFASFLSLRRCRFAPRSPDATGCV